MIAFFRVFIVCMKYTKFHADHNHLHLTIRKWIFAKRNFVLNSVQVLTFAINVIDHSVAFDYATFRIDVSTSEMEQQLQYRYWFWHTISSGDKNNALCREQDYTGREGVVALCRYYRGRGSVMLITKSCTNWQECGHTLSSSHALQRQGDQMRKNALVNDCTSQLSVN